MRLVHSLLIKWLNEEASARAGFGRAPRRPPGLRVPACSAARAARREACAGSGARRPATRSPLARSPARPCAPLGSWSAAAAAAAAAMPMKGRFPVRRTLRYLSQGDVVFKDAVKVMTVNYNSRGERGEGASLRGSAVQQSQEPPAGHLLRTGQPGNLNLLHGISRPEGFLGNLGRFPVRRTLRYLSQGDVVFKDAVKVMTVNYNSRGERGEGASPRRPRALSLGPCSARRLPLADSGEQVLVDVETKSNAEIVQHIRKILGKSEDALRKEERQKQQLAHPANFGPRKYCLRECMCQVEGQVPCPGLVPLPRDMTGKHRATLRAAAQD
ncbi:PREDICTED: 28S ribosomal protein S25, mitochondrial [Propithecus coquereli]|uniref:28S ribosomal protein S25, mitochondrial n=1 Tax=Propithecus coquereli TaxID=379532 RepID=UPI00063F8579|nr:PREDICTED: 28S ribosomal protein S25, mitochondrial [Propithecus coquereli]